MNLEEIVTIKLKIDSSKLQKQQNHFNKALAQSKQLNQQNNVVASKGNLVWNKFKENMTGLNTTMKMSGRLWSRASGDISAGTSGVKEFNNAGARLGNKVRLMAHGTRLFKMEMLGVMFFGMAMARMFKGMLSPAAKTFGIMELWGDMLTVVFLPVMQMLMPYFLDFIDMMMNLSPETKKTIGIIALLGFVFGTILFVIGTLSLGFGALILAALPLALAVFGIVLVIVGLVVAIKNWKKDSKGAMTGLAIAIIGIGLILIMFIGWWALIPILIGVVILLLIKHWDRFKLFFERLWLNMRIVFAEFVKTTMEKIQKLMNAAAKVPGVGLLWAKASDKMGVAIDEQQTKIDELNGKLAENIALRDELKYGAEGSETQTITQQSSGVESMQDQFMTAGQSTEPNVITNNITMTVEDDESITRKFEDIINSDILKLDRNGAGN